MLALAGLLPAVSSGGGGGGRGGAASAGVVTGPRGTARPCGGAEEVLRARASARGGRLRALQARVRFEVQAEDHLFASAKSAPNRLVEWRSHALSDGGAQRCRNAGGKDAVRRAHESGPAGERIVWATPEERAAAVLASAERDLAFCAREGAQRAREFGALQQALAAAREDKIRRRHAFLSEVLLRQRQLEEASFRAARMQRARNEGVLKWHSSVLNRKGRAERARIQALKADDYESYLELIKDAKNDKLKELIAKTDEVLLQLGDMVERQRRVASDAGDAHDDAVPGVDADGAKGKELSGIRKYEAAVHAVTEEIDEQPAMLDGGKLREYQMKGLKWMVSLYNNSMSGILADEMGLGKTIQAISLLAYLMESKGIHGPHMIIAPKAVCPNWRNEMERWLPDVECVLYDGTGPERRVLREDVVLPGKFTVLITHYDLVMRDKATLTKPKWQYLIIDEGHRLKNHECTLARTLGQHYSSRQRLLLTGTPIQNNLNELWSLLNFILPHVFKSSGTFDEWFGTIGETTAAAGDVNVQEEEELLIIQRLHQVIRPFILRRKKSEVAKELPAKEQVVLKCDMSAWQKHYYKQIAESASVGGAAGRTRALQNSAMQLRKCCNHPYLFLDDYVPTDPEELVRAAGKFELLDHLLPKMRASGHRVLLFSQMTKVIDLLQTYLEDCGYMYMRLDGATKTTDRDAMIKDFNAPNSPYFIFLLSTRAGGLGLNLQTADTVVMFDSDWNPQMDAQAEDRAHRIGQKGQVRVFVLVSVGTIEEDIQKRAQSKRGIDQKVIQAGMFNNQSTADERREMLSEAMTKGWSDIGREIPSLTEINQLAARSDEEYDMFEKMDAERLAHADAKKRPRLIAEEELPDWVTAADEPEEEEPEEVIINGAGKSVRKRKEVVYREVLTDRQFDMLVDADPEDGDVEERLREFTKAKIEKDKAREQRRKSAPAQAGGGAGGGGGSGRGANKRRRTMYNS